MKVNYNNMPNGMGKAYFTIRYFVFITIIFSYIRTIRLIFSNS